MTRASAKKGALKGGETSAPSESLFKDDSSVTAKGASQEGKSYPRKSGRKDSKPAFLEAVLDQSPEADPAPHPPQNPWTLPKHIEDQPVLEVAEAQADLLIGISGEYAARFVKGCKEDASFGKWYHKAETSTVHLTPP